MPEVSVLMGVYNSYKEIDALKKSIESILNQSYKDIEFIICDDGSADGTYDYLKETYGDDKRIILIQNLKNSGLAYSLNQCLSRAGGRYITRQDADDYSDETRLDKEVEFLESHKEYAFVSTNMRNYNEDGIGSEAVMIERPQKEDFLRGSPFSHPATMFRKESLMQVNNYRVAKVTRRCEDFDLFMRMYAVGMRGYNIQEALYYFKFSKKEYLRRRKYRYYFEETLVRFYGFYKMKVLFSPKGILWAMRPSIVGLVPSKIAYLRYKGMMNEDE